MVAIRWYALFFCLLGVARLSAAPSNPTARVSFCLHVMAVDHYISVSPNTISQVVASTLSGVAHETFKEVFYYAVEETITPAQLLKAIQIRDASITRIEIGETTTSTGRQLMETELKDKTFAYISEQQGYKWLAEANKIQSLGNFTSKFAFIDAICITLPQPPMQENPDPMAAEEGKEGPPQPVQQIMTHGGFIDYITKQAVPTVLPPVIHEPTPTPAQSSNNRVSDSTTPPPVPYMPAQPVKAAKHHKHKHATKSDYTASLSGLVIAGSVSAVLYIGYKAKPARKRVTN